MVAQEDSWATAGGTSKLVRLPSPNGFNQAQGAGPGLLESQMRTQQRCTSSYVSQEAASCSSQSIQVGQQLLEHDDGVGRIRLTSRHRIWLRGQKL